jgi:hypothetical protein
MTEFQVKFGPDPDPDGFVGDGLSVDGSENGSCADGTIGKIIGKNHWDDQRRS